MLFLKTASNTAQVVATVKWSIQPPTTSPQQSFRQQLHNCTNYQRASKWCPLVVVVNDWRRRGRRQTIVKTFDLSNERSFKYYASLFVALRLLRCKLVNPAKLRVARLTRHIAHHVPTGQHHPVLTVHKTHITWWLFTDDQSKGTRLSPNPERQQQVHTFMARCPSRNWQRYHSMDSVLSSSHNWLLMERMDHLKIYCKSYTGYQSDNESIIKHYSYHYLPGTASASATTKLHLIITGELHSTSDPSFHHSRTAQHTWFTNCYWRQTFGTSYLTLFDLLKLLEPFVLDWGHTYLPSLRHRHMLSRYWSLFCGTSY